MLYYYDLLKDLVPTAAATAKVRVGWFSDWDKKRRISVEQLREILREQGSPWAKELEDVVEKTAVPKSKKHAEILEEVLEEIPQRLADPVDWNSINLSLQAAAQATRATAAIKHAESALSAIRTVRAETAAENDDEEAIIMLLSA